MQLTHWFQSLLSGLFGFSAGEGDAGWRRRRVRAASASEPLEMRVLLAAGSHGEVVTSDLQAETQFNEAAGHSDSVVAGADGATGEQTSSGADGTGDGEWPGGEVAGWDPPVAGGGGGEVGGWDPPGGGGVGGGDVSGGDPGGGGQKQPKLGSGKVQILTVDDEAWEGPYREKGYDLGQFMLTRQSAGSELTAVLGFEGDASLADFVLSKAGGAHLPLSLDGTVDVAFGAGEGTVLINVRALMDSDYEPPEILTAKIVRLEGMGTIGASDSGQVTIIDRQADLDITDLDSGESLDEDKEDVPGAGLRVNSDHDAGRTETDSDWYTTLANSGLFNANVFEREDDFLDLSIRDHFSWPNDIGVESQRRLYLDFNAQAIRIWRLYPDGHLGTLAERVYSGDLVAQDDMLKVEALAPGEGKIGLRWRSAPQPELNNTADTITYTAWHVDVDIDSDNTDGLDLPPRTAWEDELEAHDYGIGKLVYPTPLPLDLQYGDQVFTPFALDVNSTANDLRVRFDYPGMQGRTGGMRIWTVGSNETSPLNPMPLENGGQLIAPGADYSVEDLRAATSGDMIFWIQAEVAQTRFSDKEGVGREKPDDRVEVTLLRPDGDGGHVDTVTDDIRYLIAEHDDTFYPNLQHNHGALRTWWRTGIHTGQTLRNALASEGVYKVEDLPHYGLKLLSGDEMRALGINAEAVDSIEDSQSPHATGIKVAVYRDFLSDEGEGYILAFAGTEADPDDIVTNVVQGLGFEGDPWLEDEDQQQYVQAMEIGLAFGDAIFANPAMSGESRSTGHSLGGGLASVASLASVRYAFHADTFNAAGVHPNTLYLRDSWGFRTDTLRHNAILKRYLAERAGLGVIRAFYNQYDLLSFMQDHLPALPIIGRIPVAIGQRIPLQGPHEPVLDARTPVLSAKLNEIPSWNPVEPWIVYFLRFDRWVDEVLDELAPIVSRMIQHHQTDYYHYGLMVERRSDSNEIVWDIFGKELL